MCYQAHQNQIVTGKSRKQTLNYEVWAKLIEELATNFFFVVVVITKQNFSMSMFGVMSESGLFFPMGVKQYKKPLQKNSKP